MITNGTRVTVCDQSSEYRNMTGTVMSSPDTGVYAVRPDGFACGATVRLREAQLNANTPAATVNYGNCA